MKTTRRKFVSLITLIFFFTTMSAFVAYKAGAFGEGFESQIKSTLFAGSELSDGSDSPGTDSAKPQVNMPSSKVGIDTVERKPVKDSPSKTTPQNLKVNNANPDDKPVNNSPNSKETYIYSTKSGPVFTPKNDTQQQQQKPKR